MNWDWDKLKQQQQNKNNIPPQMDEFLNKIKGLKFPGSSIILILVIVAIFFATSTFYTVKVDEVGVVQRFGKFVRYSYPGLNFKLPAGIEKVTKVKTKRVFKEEFGVQTVRNNEFSRFASGSENINATLMLTGDLNVALVPWIVQFKIKEPYDYLFNVRDVKRLLMDLAEASMRLVVGDRSISSIITKREEISIVAKDVLQEELNKAKTGIHIVTIEMKKTDVPRPVQPSLNEVNQAIQEKEEMIYNAKKDYNQAIPAAKGEADRTIKTAEGYALDRINRAEGDAFRFIDQYESYKNAKDITKKRIFLETMKTVFPKLGAKFIIDKDQKNFLPLLNLDKQNGGAK